MSIMAIQLGWIGFTTVRAQVFSLFLLVTLLNLLEGDRARKRLWPLLWLLLYVIWLNAHAGFLLGAGMLVFYSLERFVKAMLQERSFSKALKRTWHLLTVLSVMCVLTVANPWGADYIPYLWRAITLDRSGFIGEWSPLWLSEPWSLPLFLISIVFVIYSLVHTRCQNYSLLAFLCVTAWLALWHFRYLSIYALAWICFVPAHIQDTNIGRFLIAFSARKRIVYVGIFLLIGIGGSLVAVRNKFWTVRIPTPTVEHEKIDGLVYPVGAVQFLKDRQFVGNIMAPFEAGSYLSWKLYPAVKVSMDSRFEVAYALPLVLQNVRFYRGQEDWENIPYRHSTDAILVPNWSKLGKTANCSIGKEETNLFTKVYIDDGYSIFMRASISDRIGFTDKRGTHFQDVFP